VPFEFNNHMNLLLPLHCYWSVTGSNWWSSDGLVQGCSPKWGNAWKWRALVPQWGV